MAPETSAADVISRLGLAPHPTCGYVAETYRSPQRIAPGGLPEPFAAGRPIGSALYFLVTPQRRVQLHCICNDQTYHAYAGDPLEVLALYPDGTHEVVAGVAAQAALAPGAQVGRSIAVALAEAGGFIRVFADLGEPLARLLMKLAHSGANSSFIGRILAAFPQTTSPAEA